MKLGNALNIRGVVLDKNQLEMYMEKIASDHILKNESDKNTYPIPRLKDNFLFITKTYNILNEHLKLGITIHPAGEWLLDNYYSIDETVKFIVKELTLQKYINFLGISNGSYNGYARIYVLASEIVAYTDGKIDSNILTSLLKSYQNKKTLNMEEIWNIEVFLNIALIENIRGICEKIYSSQIQKYKAENIVERLIEQSKNLKFKMVPEYNKDFGYGEMKYPFIEHLSYKLKRHGRKAIIYLDALEEQINKMGTTVSEVIKKEHFDIAYKKISMGNSIKSLRDLKRINFLKVFEAINGVEEILNSDPANVYEKMDYKTKEYYRNVIKKISKKTKISEIYISKKILELAKKYENTGEKKKTHIGYFLVSDGINELISKLQIKDNFKKKPIKLKEKLYIYMNFAFTTIFSILLALFIYLKTNNIILGIFSGILIWFPISEIVTQVIQYMLIKIVKPKIIPKLDYTNGIPKESATMVVIPTIIKNSDRIQDLINKLEVYYLANKSENIYFTLLGDIGSSDKVIEPEDKNIINTGIKAIEEINKKYPNEGFPKFNFLYRKRTWSETEKNYLGWERKRGLLTQFNEYLLQNKENDFQCNTIEEWRKVNQKEIPNIKYVITLDADTNLILNSGLELVGAMDHILNEPVLNTQKNKVISGYGIMQPRVGLDLNISQKSLFTKIFAGAGGTDYYSNAVSDIYQDNFEEGIYTGKGIYNLKVFQQVLEKQVPDNLVLSHDLLEGNYLRCGLATDIFLMDGYPIKYNAFITRLSRWIRGDWQIIQWMKKNIKIKDGNQIKNPFDVISKYKIWDNLRRSMIDIFAMFALFYFIILQLNQVQVWPFITTSIVSIIIPSILDIINKIIYRKDGTTKQKRFEEKLSQFMTSILRGIISLSVLPHKAYVSFNSISKTLYRLCISKEHLLEWTTSEEAEANSKTDIISYYKQMIINLITGITFLVICIISENIVTKILGAILAVLWIIGPAIVWFISIEKSGCNKLQQLSNEEKEYVTQIAQRTWAYFKDNLTPENNYLPPDNYQENRIPKIIKRTSSTNIGLGLLTVISAYDLKFIGLEETLQLLEKMVNTIKKLEKWNGHLYNWYDISNLKPLIPRYISTVDSGNFVGYLYIVREFLQNIISSSIHKDNNTQVVIEPNNKLEINLQTIELMLKIINETIENTNFSYLYDEEKQLFSIGFNLEENKLTDSYYDLLASEARQASLIAIAKKDISQKHWNSLSRTLTTFNRYKGLISWAGTAFEYLMPNINIIKYPGSLLDESTKFLIMCQKEYSKKLGIPWGISESAFNVKDLNSNYQYKSFGIPWLGLKRGLEDEMVVSSYGSILAITEEPKDVISNIKTLEEQGAYGKYGFYEAIDYTPSRLNYGNKYEIVKTYMAHHQALILLSINNLMNKNILVERFMRNPEILAVDILLQERMPENVIITKERKEKITKMKYETDNTYEERVYSKINENLLGSNVISNENYMVAINQKGEGFSKYKDYYVNRYKNTWEETQGIWFFIKNIRTKKIWRNINQDNNKQEKYSAIFSPDKDKFERVDENIKTTTRIITAPNAPVEIRQLELQNNGSIEETLEITSYMEPVLSDKWQDYSHRAFNNLFIKYDKLEELNAILARRNKRGNKNAISLGTMLCTQAETIGELEYEIDKEKLYANKKQDIPNMVEDSKPFSKTIGIVTDPIIALKRTVKIKPKEKAILNLIICVNEEEEVVKQYLEEYKNNEVIDTVFDLSKAKSDEESRYLGATGQQISQYEKIMGYLIFNNPMRNLELKNIAQKDYHQSDLWKYGISGDLPILLVDIKNIEDISFIKEILKAYEYIKNKGIDFDLVILDEEEKTYENYIEEAIEAEILNQQLSYLKNQRGGIFVLREIEDKDILQFKANLILNAHQGNLTTILKDKEEEYLDSIKNVGYYTNTNKMEFEKNGSNLDIETLQYYNEYGGFSSDGNEYKMKISKETNVPITWSHVIANKNFGTVVTQNLGGYTWSDNCKLKRLTSWSNNSVMDTPSEVIYLKDIDNGNSWSLGNVPMPDESDYVITFGFGYANCNHTSYGIIQNLDIFVPKEQKAKVNLVTLKNILPSKRKLKMVYFIKPVLGEDEEYTNGYIHLEWNKNSNLISAKNLYVQGVEQGILYITSSEKIQSYTGDKKFFEGNGKMSNPEGLQKVSLNNEDALGKDSCIAIQLEFELEAFETKEISIILGQEKDIQEAKQTAYQLSKVVTCEQELQNVKRYWQETLKCVQVKTPVESINILLNGWIAYQTICSRLWARSGFYQSGGAFGFRDQLQDTLGIKYLQPEFMKQQIIKHSKHQFLEGDVEHWWHEENKRGIRTRFSDDLLWLPYVTFDYIKYTNDVGILDIMTPYLQKTEELEDGVDEKYDEHIESNIQGTIYEHCVRAIDRSLQFGENGLPKIGSGDWNDALSTVGNQGKGESVWLGFFLYMVLDRFIPICRDKGEIQRADKYEEIKSKLKKALNTKGWDGRWYKRAFTDDGDVLGSIENEECRIDSIAQSWSVISKAGDNDKKYISMESLENHLVDKENGIIKLLDPPFEKSKLEPGYIKAYLPGVRENGGQYTHAAIWFIIAQAILGFGNKAFEFYKMINPIEHSKTKEGANKYKVEPYVIAADIYGSGALIGRGGWTWYTGSSSWYYKAGIEYILGLKIENGMLSINPCIPNIWKEYSIHYRYKTSMYHIRVKNPNGKETGIEKFIVNEQEIEEKKIHLVDNGKIYEIEVIM